MPCADASRRISARKPEKSLSAARAILPPSGTATSDAAASSDRRLGRKGIMTTPPRYTLPRSGFCQNLVNNSIITSQSFVSQRQGARQPERDRRNIGDRHQHEEHDAVKRPDLLHHVFHADAAPVRRS